MPDKKSPYTFPSHFVSQKTKMGRDWCLQYMEAFHQEGNVSLTGSPNDFSIVGRQNVNNYARWRSYGRGEQGEDQYKELMGLKKEKGKFTESFRNLNFAILKVAPKIRYVLKNKVLNQRHNIIVKPIDQASLNEKQQYRARLAEYVTNMEEIQRFEMLTKLGLEKPIGPGEIPPASHVEIDPWMELHPKNAMAMEVKDYISWALYYNDWEQLKDELVGDIIDDGVAGTRCFLDPNNFVRVRRIHVDRSISNRCIYPDFRDLIRFGEYYEITVSELRRITKGQLVGEHGETGEDVYRKIANSLPDSNNRYVNNATEYWNASTFSYAYDHEKVTVLDGMWYSDDEDTHVEYQNDSGNMRVKKEEYGYTPFKGDAKVNGGKGMTDQEYEKHTQGRKKIIRERNRNVYKASWIVNTKMIYNYGLMEQQLVSVSMTGEAHMPVALTTTDFMSTIGSIEQGLDQIQIQWLQFQSHSSASKPPGIAIEKRALANVAKGGKGGKDKWDPKEDLMLWAEFGSFVYDGYDQHGNPLNHLPFQELKGGLSPGAMEHFALIVQMIELIRNQLGLNQLSEGANTPERMGKTVAQISLGASDNALSHITKAFRKIYEKTARNVVMLMQSAIDKINEQGMMQGLGQESVRFFKLNSDIGMREMGITIEEGPDEMMREKISAILNNAVAAKEIAPEDALLMEMEDNPYKVIIQIRKKTRERQMQAAKQQEDLVRMQGEENTRTAVATQQAKDNGEMERIQREERTEILRSNLRKQEEAEKFLQQLALEKLKIGKDMDESERQFFIDVMKMNNDFRIAEMQAQATKQRAKAAA